MDKYRTSVQNVIPNIKVRQDNIVILTNQQASFKHKSAKVQHDLDIEYQLRKYTKLGKRKIAPNKISLRFLAQRGGGDLTLHKVPHQDVIFSGVINLIISMSGADV